MHSILNVSLPNKRIKIVRSRSLGRRYRGAPYAERWAKNAAMILIDYVS